MTISSQNQLWPFGQPYLLCSRQICFTAVETKLKKDKSLQMYGFHKVFITLCEKEERKFLKMSKKVHHLEVCWCLLCPREQLHFTPLSLVMIWISHHSLFSIPLDPGRLVLSPRGSSREKPSSSTSQEFGFPAKNENLLQRSQSTSAELRLFPLLGK